MVSFTVYNLSIFIVLSFSILPPIEKTERLFSDGLYYPGLYKALIALVYMQIPGYLFLIIKKELIKLYLLKSIMVGYGI